MVAFQKKTLTPTKRICLRLKEAREQAGFSLDELSHKTKIDKVYIEALEQCNFDKLPDGPVYHKHFIKTYLKAIGLEPQSYIRQYLIEEDIRTTPASHPHKNIQRRAFHNLPSLWRWIIATSMVLLLASYFGNQVYRILEPPPLTILSPADGFITEQTTITVQGQSMPEIQISINGTDIASNAEGQFEQILDLAPGVNNIAVRATKRHGKITEINRHVISKQP